MSSSTEMTNTADDDNTMDDENNHAVDVTTLSYRQLQEECQRLGLSAGGTTNALRQRLRGHYRTHTTEDEDEQPPQNRPRRCVSDSLLCPITLELPLDPVAAQDGYVYERTAIERWFQGKRRDQIKSPMTNEHMQMRLMAVTQTKSLIRTLVETGVITGPLAETWKERLQLKEARDALLKKAQDGDVTAMEEAAESFYMGMGGFEQNQVTAYHWAQRAHRAESVLGTGMMGCMLASGTGVVQNEAAGAMYLGIAAGKGLDWAMYILAHAMTDGLYGFPVDRKEALRILEEAMSGTCPHSFMKGEDKNHAELLLTELREGAAGEGATASA